MLRARAFVGCFDRFAADFGLDRVGDVALRVCLMVQGSEFVTESLAEYSALMVLKQKYGDAKMHRFLKYELDRYLLGRGSEHKQEQPLVRADGAFLYTLPSVADDIDMAISHVVRGEDHVTNTAAQIEIFQALGGPVPKFAHFPLLVGASGAICGLLGLYLAIYPLNEITCFYWFFRPGTFDIKGYLLIIGWFLWDIWEAVRGAPGIASWAHVGGTIAGFGLGLILLKLRRVYLEEYDHPTMLEIFSRRSG